VRALSEFFVTLAALATIAAATVRIWWSKPRPMDMSGKPGFTEGYHGVPLQDPKAPSWLRRLARVWLYVVAIGATVGAIILVVVFIVRIIALS
jgi:hypothetical protein